MSNTVWQIQEGRGAKHLDTIASHVDAWNRWGENLTALEDQDERLDSLASFTANETIEQWLSGEAAADIEHLGLETEPSVQALFAQAALARVAHQRVAALREGLFLDGTDKKARIHVIGSGVMRSTGFVEPGHGIDIRGKFKPVEKGTVLEGKIRQFKSTPKIGGWMQISHGGDFITSYVQGFVNPRNGAPQTELEIMKKVKRS